MHRLDSPDSSDVEIDDVGDEPDEHEQEVLDSEYEPDDDELESDGSA